MSTSGSVDFIPAACQAHNIANCVASADYQLETFELPGIDFNFTKSVDGFAQVQLTINELDACFLVSLALAFAEAGCQMPTIPDPPDPEELREMIQECADRVTEGAAEAANPIGVWSEVMDITFDEDGTPTRIQA